MKKIAPIIILILILMSIGGIAAQKTDINIPSLRIDSISNTNTFYTYTYVGNANTGVFHKSSCHYINKMNPSNKVYFNTRKGALNAGYRPCKVCHP